MTDEVLARAVRLLGRRDHFEADLRDRLLAAGCEPDAVERTIGRCRELGMLDDDRVAARFAELRSLDRGWGPYRLEQELRRRGAPENIAAAAARLSPERLTAALERALERTERRAPDGWWRLGAERARMVSSLLRYGFSAEDARSAVDDLAGRREREHHALDDEPRDPSDLP